MPIFPRYSTRILQRSPDVAGLCLTGGRVARIGILGKGARSGGLRAGAGFTDTEDRPKKRNGKCVAETPVRGSRWRPAGCGGTEGLRPEPVGESPGRGSVARREGAGGRVRLEGAGDRSFGSGLSASRAA